MKANPKNKRSRTSREKRPEETLKERVHRHLNDINSKITDDDIRNVKTELGLRADTNPENIAVSTDEKKKRGRKAEKQKEENETDRSDKHTTPWDILSEGYD